jgi:hypothetical protein
MNDRVRASSKDGARIKKWVEEKEKKTFAPLVPLVPFFFRFVEKKTLRSERFVFWFICITCLL